MSSSTTHSAGSASTPRGSTTTRHPTSDDILSATTTHSSSPSGSGTGTSHSTSSTTTHTSVAPQSTLTTVSVTVIRPSPSTIMSFVTVAPDSTLASPLALTVTGADGRTTLSTPALVTLVSTSTKSDGTVTATTHVVANPVPDRGEPSTRTGILQNEGALAGIFVAVGLVVALLIGACIWLIRKRKKIARREAWISSIKPPQPGVFSTEPHSNPFQDPPPDNQQNEAPYMRTLNQDKSDYLWGSSGTNAANRSSDHSDHSNGHGQPSASVYPDTYPILRPNQRTSPTNYAMDTSVPAPGIGYGYAMRERIGRPGMPEPHLAPQRTSTPSLYPASVHEEKNEQYDQEAIRAAPTSAPFMTRQLQRLSIPPVVPQKPISDIGYAMMTAPPVASASSLSRTPSGAAPPRPPRSHLRKNSTRSVDFIPLTPPDSQAHSPSKTPPTPSPISETRTQDIYTRRTLLDVRSRSLIS